MGSPECSGPPDASAPTLLASGRTGLSIYVNNNSSIDAATRSARCIQSIWRRALNRQPFTLTNLLPQDISAHIAGFIADEVRPTNPLCYRSARCIQALWRRALTRMRRNVCYLCTCRQPALERTFYWVCDACLAGLPPVDIPVDDDGYDIEGYDTEGYDRDGYDYAGFDIHGSDRDGHRYDDDIYRSDDDMHGGVDESLGWEQFNDELTESWEYWD